MNESRWKRTLKAKAAARRQHQTTCEDKLWFRLRNRRLDALSFRRQHVVGGCIVDFYCAELRLAVQLRPTGRKWDFASEDASLRARGITVLTFSESDVQTRFGFVLRLIFGVAQQRRRRIAQSNRPAEFGARRGTTPHAKRQVGATRRDTPSRRRTAPRVAGNARPPSLRLLRVRSYAHDFAAEHDFNAQRSSVRSVAPNSGADEEAANGLPNDRQPNPSRDDGQRLGGPGSGPSPNVAEQSQRPDQVAREIRRRLRTLVQSVQTALRGPRPPAGRRGPGNA